LGVEVRLRKISGKRGSDRHHEGDGSDHPRQAAAVAPGSLAELRPEVERQRKEEGLRRPEMQAVDEVARGADMPPLRAEEGQGQAGEDQQYQAREGDHPKQINRRPHECGQAVGEQVLEGQPRPHPLAQPRREVHDALSSVVSSRAFDGRGPGRRKKTAAAKTAISNTTTTRLATEITMKPEWK
jgi:hypothetical protein